MPKLNLYLSEPWQSLNGAGREHPDTARNFNDLALLYYKKEDMPRLNPYLSEPWQSLNVCWERSILTPPGILII